jgi:hypothetical protein
VSLRITAALAVLSVAASTACSSREAGKSTGETSGSKETAPSVQSSLKSLSVLPPTVEWTATTSLPPARVREVRFLVAGHRWWIDRTPPYTYGPEGAVLPARFISSVAESGDLVTFGVRVISTDGKRGIAASHARTPEPSLARNAPGNFGGSFPHFGYYGFGRLSAADLANPPRGYLGSSYTGWLDFVRAGLFTGAGGGKRQFAWEMASDAKRIYLGTPIFLDAAGGPATNHGYRTLKASLCPTAQREATYAWSVRQGRLYATNYHVRYLELRPLDESCNARRKMLEGVWEEVTD